MEVISNQTSYNTEKSKMVFLKTKDSDVTYWHTDIDGNGFAITTKINSILIPHDTNIVFDSIYELKSNIYLNVSPDVSDQRFKDRHDTIQISMNELCKNQITTEVSDDDGYDYLLIGRVHVHEEINNEYDPDIWATIANSAIKVYKCADLLRSSVMELSSHFNKNQLS